jgi:hypothetical protein
MPSSFAGQGRIFDRLGQQQSAFAANKTRLKHAVTVPKRRHALTLARFR